MSDKFGENKPTVENKPTGEQRAEQSVAIGDPSPNSPMLKLDIDCFEELFEWLPLKDLRALRRTCKRLKNVTDYYIRQNYGPKESGFRGLKVDSDDALKKIAEMDPDRKKFINKIRIWCDENLIKSKIDDLKPILNQVTRIEIGNWQNETDFDEVFLKHCSNLKCLCIFDIMGKNLMGKGNKWLQREYPTLEHLILCYDFDYEDERNEIRELRTFFELNPNVRTFSTTLQFLWINRLWLRGSNINLDQLEIQGGGSLMLDPCFRFVNELHRQGFYKRLHFYGIDIDEDGELLRTAQLPGLEKLYLAYLDLTIALPPLEGVKELNFVFSEDIKHPNILASNIPHVEIIHIKEAKIDDILPFIRLSPNVSKIRVGRLLKENDLHFKDNPIDLVALNKERKKLAGARKITLFLKERIYLATKWAAMKTECSLIQIKRSDPKQIKLFNPHYIFMEDFF